MNISSFSCPWIRYICQYFTCFPVTPIAYAITCTYPRRIPLHHSRNHFIFCIVLFSIPTKIPLLQFFLRLMLREACYVFEWNLKWLELNNKIYILYCINFKAAGTRIEHVKQSIIPGQFSCESKLFLWILWFKKLTKKLIKNLNPTQPKKHHETNCPD